MRRGVGSRQAVWDWIGGTVSGSRGSSVRAREGREVGKIRPFRTAGVLW